MKLLLLALLAIFILFNLIAYNHANAMLNFRANGSRTEPIEALTVSQKMRILVTGISIPKPLNDATPNDFGLTFSAHHFESSSEHELEAWYIPASSVWRRKPKGLVLFFHGYAESKSSLLDEAATLNQMGYSALLVDFRGSGGSSGTQTTVGYLESDDVVAALAYARTSFAEEPIVLYGRSMGAAAILRSVATHKIVPNGIILESVFAEMLTTVKNRFWSMGLPSFPAAYALIFWSGQQSGFSGFQHNPTEYADSVMMPALMLHGADDPRATLGEGKRVYDAIVGQRKRFVPFEDSGHESLLRADRDLWKKEVQSFLEGLH